jgi:hypothetical protein
LFSLWKDVTYYLKSKQLDKATESKSFLEQRQREGAKERAEKSIKWQTKVTQTKQNSLPLNLLDFVFQYFAESGEQKWSYENKLQKRLKQHS